MVVPLDGQRLRMSGAGRYPRFIRLARIFQCLALPRQPLKLLETLEIRVLERLASGVKLLRRHKCPYCNDLLEIANLLHPPNLEVYDQISACVTL